MEEEEDISERKKHETMRNIIGKKGGIVRGLEKDDRMDYENYRGQKWKETVEDDEGQKRRKEARQDEEEIEQKAERV